MFAAHRMPLPCRAMTVWKASPHSAWNGSVRCVSTALSGPGVGSAKVDTSQAPLVDSVAKSVRYWITGAFTTGDVVLTWVTGSPALKSTVIANVTVPSLVDLGPSTIDIVFPNMLDANRIVASSLDFTQFDLREADHRASRRCPLDVARGQIPLGSGLGSPNADEQKAHAKDDRSAQAAFARPVEAPHFL